ncbi:ATP-binding cassette domain-containing protein [Salinibacterium amurskyense]|uniref:ATP-binding cassette domain-containing protein n=1 Tax=Salinibacterium amurskyense TaxID=205941 RepID=UPI003120212B
MENAQTPDEGKKTVETPVTKPASSTRKPATARGSQAKSSAAKPSASATRKPAAKKPAARKAPARSTSAAATNATPAPGESTVPKPSSVAAKSATAKPGAAKPSAAAKRPASKSSTAASAGAKTSATKNSRTSKPAAAKKPASRAAGAKPETVVTAAEDAERTLTSSDNSTGESVDVVVESPSEAAAAGVAAPKPGAPKPKAPKPSAPKPTSPRSTSPKPTAPAADAAVAARAADDAEVVETAAVETTTDEVPEAEAETAHVDAPDADTDASKVGVDADSADDTESSADDTADATAEVKDPDEAPAAEEKPDAVLAGLARLRALASQFAAPAAEAAAQKAAAQKLADEKTAADKAETDKFEAERAEAEKAEAEAEAEAEKAEAERVEAERLAAETADADVTEIKADASSIEANSDELPVDEVPAAEEDAAQTDAAESTTAAPVEAEPETAAPEDEQLSSDAPTIVVELESDDVAAPETDEASAALVAVDATVSHGLEATSEDVVLQVNGLSKDFGDTVAVDDIRLSVRAGVFYGIVGPNGAGKTTTLSMITGLLRPDSGNATVNGVDVWESPEVAKRSIGVLPDRLRIFDRLTGSQLLYYSGVLRGLNSTEVRKRSADLATAFGLDDVMGRLVSDYSSGMLKKVALAAAMIHSPRLLVLDEPFESVDPVSAATVTRILKQYVNAGGTVLLSSHRMELVQRVCSHVAVIVEGKLLADGTIDEVRNGMSLEDRFVQLTGKNSSGGGLEWLSSFSD